MQGIVSRARLGMKKGERFLTSIQEPAAWQGIHAMIVIHAYHCYRSEPSCHIFSGPILHSECSPL